MPTSVPRLYLDYNASAPLLPEARDAMLIALDSPGNASSVHKEGRFHRQIIDQARRDVADLVTANPDRVIFTSGATEAAANVLTPNWQMGRGKLAYDVLLVGATEHPCISAGGRFQTSQVQTIDVDANGLIKADYLRDRLEQVSDKGQRALVAIQLANSETGVMQDIKSLAALTHELGGLFVCDAVQAAGRVAINMNDLGVDVLIVSAHKMGGPKGIGAVIYASDILRAENLLTGGGQEKSFRSGTENTAALAGFSAAAQVCKDQLHNRMIIKNARDQFETELLKCFPQCIIHGQDVERLDNTCFFSIPQKSAETLQIAFDLAGLAVSAGSACSSGKVGQSHVLDAMGFEGEGAIPISFGPDLAENVVERLLAVVERVMRR